MTTKKQKTAKRSSTDIKFVDGVPNVRSGVREKFSRQLYKEQGPGSWHVAWWLLDLVETQGAQRGAIDEDKDEQGNIIGLARFWLDGHEYQVGVVRVPHSVDDE